MPISAIEHYAYCPRQAVLIWQEAYFESNADTVRGDIAHAAVDRGGTLTGRRGARVWRSLPVYSNILAIHGVCDTVEWTDAGPIPVEHKSGRYAPGGPADLQVAAQVLCLREMLEQPVPHGLVFAGKSRRRYEVQVNEALVASTTETIEALRHQMMVPIPPPPVNDHRCKRCSLRPGCMPEISSSGEIDLFTPRRPRDL
ncbi:CRISPR-associated protein Cas4 [Nocardia huaxiensis]|uniref:CRISPR-associated protein Cas4 n=1 Tax=Nocardia huaxiensis TaxID=2755382 RepID=UPI001C67BD14|nr:CRISPR-associated protein Cas4 [Nocardia huaxiensis]